MIKNLWGGVIALCLSMCLSSCEGALDDVLGEWSRPTPGNNTPSGGGSSTIAVTSVKLDKAYLRFDKTVLTAQTLTATLAPDDATDKTVTWESSDESVASVDENGQVTPITKGTVTITATAHDGSGIKATSTVIVYDKIHDINTEGDAGVTTGESWLIKGNATTPVANSINIGDGASATLLDVFITQPITCPSTATIILADGSTNTVDASGINDNAAIIVGGAGKTLTIEAETLGDGKLIAKGGSDGAGIGMDKVYGTTVTRGNIIIEGGVIEATGGTNAAGIGTGLGKAYTTHSSSPTIGTITINGGTVTAKGGANAAGIGTGYADATGSTTTAVQSCGDITIGPNVTSVTATKGTDSPNSIGAGNTSTGFANHSIGTITIDPSANVTQN